MQFSFISFHKHKLDQHLGDVKANVFGLLVISPELSLGSGLTTTLLTPLPLPITTACHVLMNDPTPGDDLMCGCE